MQSLSQVFTITFANPAIQWNPGTPPPGTIGTAWSWQMNQPTGGQAPYTFVWTPGQTVPAGFTLTSGGLLSGTPTVATVNFPITVNDSSP